MKKARFAILLSPEERLSVPIEKFFFGGMNWSKSPFVKDKYGFSIKIFAETF